MALEYHIYNVAWAHVKLLCGFHVTLNTQYFLLWSKYIHSFAHWIGPIAYVKAMDNQGKIAFLDTNPNIHFKFDVFYSSNCLGDIMKDYSSCIRLQNWLQQLMISF
jgi:hypothetical protein